MSSSDQPSSAANLMLLLKNNQTAENKVDSTPDFVENKQGSEDQKHTRAEHKRELAWQLRIKKRTELEKLREQQVRGITILMTEPTGKILTLKLTNEGYYIDFISSVFDSWRAAHQITDYRILQGDQNIWLSLMLKLFFFYFFIFFIQV